MMDAPHWRGSVAKVRDRVSGSAWIPIRAKPAQQSNKVNTVFACKRLAERLAQASLKALQTHSVSQQCPT